MRATLKTRRETKRARNKVKEGRREREFLSSRCPRAAASPKKVKKGTSHGGAKGVALMGRKVRLAAVLRVVMRN